MQARRLATLGTIGAVGYLIVVPVLHIAGPVYPHAAPRVTVTHVARVTPDPSPNPYLPLGAPQTAPQASAGGRTGGHHIAGGYIAYRAVRHVFWRHRRWGFRNPFPWWMR